VDAGVSPAWTFLIALLQLRLEPQVKIVLARRQNPRARRTRYPKASALYALDFRSDFFLDNFPMKTLLTTLAILILSITSLLAKEGTFASVIIRETDQAFRLSLAARQWIKITNFTQNDTTTTRADSAGVAVIKGEAALWVLFASDPATTHVAHEDVFVAGPATIMVTPITGATVFLTYQRGSD
jgi:hypothetical protein